MHTYVALLRGINVGGNNKIEMAKLQARFVALGHHNVTTYINSGNVIFSSPQKNLQKLTSDIETMIQTDFGLDIPVVLCPKATIAKICQKVPTDWTNDKDHKTDVLFLWEDYAERKTLQRIDQNPAVDTLIYVAGAIVWHLEKRHYNQSKMHELVGTPLYKSMTVRNINTVRKLQELLS